MTLKTDSVKSYHHGDLGLVGEMRLVPVAACDRRENLLLTAANITSAEGTKSSASVRCNINMKLGVKMMKILHFNRLMKIIMYISGKIPPFPCRVLVLYIC